MSVFVAEADTGVDKDVARIDSITAARVLIETAHGHVFDHARPQWADGPR
jgi:hypothetical protein